MGNGPALGAAHLYDHVDSPPSLKHTPVLETPPFVAFVGKMGTGKTTMAGLVRGKYEYVQPLSFAFRLKVLADAVDYYGNEREHFVKVVISDLGEYTPLDINARNRLLRGWLNALEDYAHGELTKREFFQIVGTDVGRGVHPDLWINPVMQQVRDTETQAIGYVLDDARFVNEGEALADHGFFIVRLTVPEDVRQQRLYERDGKVPEEATQKHASELEIDDIAVNYTLDNSRDLITVREELFAAIESHQHRPYHQRRPYTFGVDMKEVESGEYLGDEDSDLTEGQRQMKAAAEEYATFWETLYVQGLPKRAALALTLAYMDMSKTLGSAAITAESLRGPMSGIDAVLANMKQIGKKKREEDTDSGS